MNAPFEPLLLVDAKAEVSARYRLRGGEAVVFTRPSPEREGAPSEDAAAIIQYLPNAWVLAVADGVGGGASGGKASRRALAALTASLCSVSDTTGSFTVAVLNGFDRANQAVRELGVGAATTLAVVTLRDQVARSFYVGDSAILIAGQRGRIKYQSVSHSPVGYGVEAGLIDERAALHHEDRHLVSNVVGSAEMSVQVGPKVPLGRRDTLLIASDGLYDNLYADEIVQAVRKGTLDESTDQLSNEVGRRMSEPRDGRPHKPDDLTFVLYRRSE